MFEDTYKCGPVEILVVTPTKLLRELIRTNFNLYNAPWKELESRVKLDVKETISPREMLTGNYLIAQRTHVDVTETGLAATSFSGSSAVFSAEEKQWSMYVPPGPLDIWGITDLEHLLSLVVTTSWRELAWVPLHAAAITNGGSCAVLCASSGGGKTTLTAAMIRRGWKTLGDDKLLLKQMDSGPIRLRALVHTLNLYPGSHQWFPEIGDLEKFPHYSVWTDKRRVRITDVWPGKTVHEGSPTHLVNVVQNWKINGIKMSSLRSQDVLAILLRQTVVPNHRGIAANILQTIANTASQLSGFDVQIGYDAFSDPECLTSLEESLQ